MAPRKGRAASFEKPGFPGTQRNRPKTVCNLRIPRASPPCAVAAVESLPRVRSRRGMARGPLQCALRALRLHAFPNETPRISSREHPSAVQFKNSGSLATCTAVHKRVCTAGCHFHCKAADKPYASVSVRQFASSLITQPPAPASPYPSQVARSEQWRFRT